MVTLLLIALMGKSTLLRIESLLLRRMSLKLLLLLLGVLVLEMLVPLLKLVIKIIIILWMLLELLLLRSILIIKEHLKFNNKLSSSFAFPCDWERLHRSSSCSSSDIR